MISMFRRYVPHLILMPALVASQLVAAQHGSAPPQGDVDQKNARAMTIIVVEALENEPQVTMPGGDQPRTLRVGDQVEPGSTITTNIKSKIALVFQAIDGFGTKDLLVLAPLARATIERRDDATGGEPQLVATIERGAFRTQIAQANREPRFMLKHGDHLVHLRQSDMFGDVAQDRDIATFYVNSGSIAIEDGGRQIQLGERMQREIENGRIMAATEGPLSTFMQLSQATQILDFDLATTPPQKKGINFSAPPGVTIKPVEPQPLEAPTIDPDAPPAFVKMATSHGDIYLQLDPGRAPATVENFLHYVRDGFYDGTTFHRVVSDFMIQGGGFAADGSRKQTHEPIRNESANGLSNQRGTIAMARTAMPDSATSQFFINVGDNSRLDAVGERAGYAVFGEVVRGMDVVDAIRKVPVQPNPQGEISAPVDPIIIEEVTIVSEEQAKGASAE